MKKVLIGLGAGISKFFNFNSISDPNFMPFDHGMMRANFAPKPIMAAKRLVSDVFGAPIAAPFENGASILTATEDPIYITTRR